ncbi:hypothetical protein C8R45DRAFT_949111 [Mycena sanguinolenta]|nr:hypothetical protein C8R45DRAFT_949111 [Mycena sanguinolenta]
MPTFATNFCLSRSRTRRHSPQPTRKLTRRRNTVATVAAVELDPELQAIRVVRKPRNTVKRRLVMLWKHLSTPSRPRASRRFSFIPPDFALVSLDGLSNSQRDPHRRSIYFGAVDGKGLDILDRKEAGSI